MSSWIRPKAQAMKQNQKNRQIEPHPLVIKRIPVRRNAGDYLTITCGTVV